MGTHISLKGFTEENISPWLRDILSEEKSLCEGESEDSKDWMDEQKERKKGSLRRELETRRCEEVFLRVKIVKQIIKSLSSFTFLPI